MTITSTYQVLVGAGKIYIAPYGTTFPLVTAAPAAAWLDAGETDGGIEVDWTQKIDLHTTDQRTGNVKATRGAESMSVTVKLVQGTLENLARALGTSATDIPPATGVPGTHEMSFHRGFSVTEWALLFRGNSPYGDFPAQYQVPRGVMSGSPKLQYTKDKKTVYEVKFEVLEDLAATAGQEYGKLVAQDAAAL